MIHVISLVLSSLTSFEKRLNLKGIQRERKRSVMLDMLLDSRENERRAKQQYRCLLMPSVQLTEAVHYFTTSRRVTHLLLVILEREG